MPFTEMHLNDLVPANSAAVDKRIRALGGVPVCHSDLAGAAIDKIVAAVNPNGLHFAFLDPYNLEGLSFDIIRKLSKLKRVDMLIHVSVQDLQRNLDDYSKPGGVFDSFAPGWRDQVDPKQAINSFRVALMEYWLGEIRKLGTMPRQGRRGYRRAEETAALLARICECARACAKAMGSDPRSHKTDIDGFLMADTSIEWTDATWNPVAGCTVTSPGCTNCYAMRMAARLDAMGMKKYRALTRKSGKRAVWTGKVRLDREALGIPAVWKKPRRIFVNSMSDLFHDAVPAEFVAAVWRTMQATPQHTFQILTKRPDRMAEITASLSVQPNVWLGASVENADYLRRIDELRRVNAAVRFVSFEPLLGSVAGADLRGIQWAIVGGESGPRSRPMAEEWVGEIETACRKASMAFFFKQWGGVRKKSTGRHYRGRTFDEMPSSVALRVETSTAA